MTKNMKSLITIFFISILLSTKSFSIEKVHLASLEYPPFYGQSLKYGGVITEIIRESFKAVDIKADISFHPWTRALRMVKEGKVHGVFGIWLKKERRKYFYYSSSPLISSDLAAISLKKSSLSFKNINDLKNKVVGIIRGYSYPQSMLNIKSTKFVYSSSEVKSMKKLIHERVDYIIMDVNLAKHIIKNNFSDYPNLIFIHYPVIASMKEYLAISKKKSSGKLIIDQFNKGLSKIKKEGILKKLFSEHHMEEMPIPN